MRRPHSHHLHSYQVNLQWHDRTHDDLRLAWSCRGLLVVRSVGLRLCLPPGAGLSSGFAPLATVPSRVDPRGCGVAFFRLPSRSDRAHTTIFRLRRRLGLHYLPIAGTVVDGHQGVSTHQWACMPRLWGPLLLRDPVQLSLEPQGTSYHVCHEEACTRSWQWIGYVPAKEAYTLGSSFRPWRTKGYPLAESDKQ